MITPTKVEPTSGDTHIVGVASGVWSLQDQLEAKRGGTWPDASVPNPDTFIENNFSIDLWTGTSSARSITNGIDLANKGGLVWIKNRGVSASHRLYDTNRGIYKDLRSDQVYTENTDTTQLTAFNSNGFSLGADNGGLTNYSTHTYVGWTFKKAPNFFDIVTYTGTGSDQNISHNLGSKPGMILIKNLSQTDNWAVYHRQDDPNTPSADKYYILNTDAALSSSTRDWFAYTLPTSSVFTVASDHSVNASGENYVAYLFGHDTSSDGMIQCGSYTGGSGNTEINLGFEPQFLMIKRSDSAEDWLVLDAMRGLVVSGDDVSANAQKDIMWNNNNSEATPTYAGVSPQANGFKVRSGLDALYSANGGTYIYMAIRRPNMATITDATKVFGMDTRGSTGDGNEPAFRSTFPVDFAINKVTNSGTNWTAKTRLMQGKDLNPNTTIAEQNAPSNQFDYMNGHFAATDTDSNQQSWMWKRAKGYFDVVAYTGTGSNRTVTHGLGVVPEMMWVFNRSSTQHKSIYHKGLNGGTNPANYRIWLNLTSAEDLQNANWNDTAPTSTVFTVGDGTQTNENNSNMIAYLFATLAGVSKVGSVTHSGSSTDVDCGFTSGARFVLLKRTDATGDWYIWDSTNGIIAGNDPYLLLNSTAAQVTNTDLIDPLSSGFTITGDFTDGDYIFYAIA
jgi:hypothetical protein